MVIMENKFENDLFSMPELWPDELKEIIDRYGEEFASGTTDQYKLCREMQREVNQLGYDFDWGLDGEPYNLRDEFEFLNNN